jgi:hypothetical protein
MGGQAERKRVRILVSFGEPEEEVPPHGGTVGDGGTCPGS